MTEKTTKNEATVTYYDLGEKGIIAKLNIPEASKDSKKTEKKLEWKTMVVLDISGSMGQTVADMVTHLLPQSFMKLGMKGSEPIDLVTFESTTKHQIITIDNMPKSGLRGNLQMI